MASHNTHSADSTPTPRFHARMAAANRNRLRRYVFNIILVVHCVICFMALAYRGEWAVALIVSTIFVMAMDVFVLRAEPLRPEAKEAV